MSIANMPPVASLYVALSVVEGNEMDLAGQVVDGNGNAVDLTAYTLSFVLKADADDTDESGTTFTPTAASGTQGKWTLTIAGSYFTVSGPLWYRLDVVDADSNATTADYGVLTVIVA